MSNLVLGNSACTELACIGIYKEGGERDWKCSNGTVLNI